MTLASVPTYLQAAGSPAPGSLATRAMLVDLTTHKWSATAKALQIASKGAQATGADPRMVRASKSLLISPELVALNQKATLIAKDYRAMTLPWLDKGPRVLSSAGFFNFEKAMRQHEADWLPLRDAFVAVYPSQRDAAKLLLNGEFDPADYPDPWKIGDRFTIGYTVLPFPDAADFRVDIGDAAATAIRAQIEQTTRDAMQLAMADVWTRMQKVVAAMVERLSAYTVTADGVSGKFHDTLVTNVRDLVDLLPSLNLTGDRAIDEFTERMRADLCAYSPQTLRDSQHAREETQAAAQAILDTMAAFV